MIVYVLTQSNENLLNMSRPIVYRVSLLYILEPDPSFFILRGLIELSYHQYPNLSILAIKICSKCYFLGSFRIFSFLRPRSVTTTSAPSYCKLFFTKIQLLSVDFYFYRRFFEISESVSIQKQKSIELQRVLDKKKGAGTPAPFLQQ